MARVQERFTVRFPDPPPRYDRQNEAAFRLDLEQLLDRLLDRSLRRPVKTFADGDTTPSVNRGNIWKANNSAPTTITAFDGGEVGQDVTIICVGGNTTVQDGANLQLQGGGNYNMNANDTLRLVFDGTTWFETGRSKN